MYEYYTSDELYHYGRKGMKWGQHIYGKVKAAKTAKRRKAALVKARAAKSAKKVEADKRKSELTNGKLSTKDMTDAELKSAIARLQMEKQYKELYNSLNPQKVSAGKEFLNKTIMPALTESGKTLLRDYATKKGKELLGLNEVDDVAALKKTVERLNLQKQVKDLSKDNSLRDKVTTLTLEKQLDTLTKEKAEREAAEKAKQEEPKKDKEEK